jgi:hypothetical protein
MFFHTVTMAYRNPPRTWAPSHIRFTSEAQFDRICRNDDPEGRTLKREDKNTRQRSIIENLDDSNDLLRGLHP